MRSRNRLFLKGRQRSFRFPFCQESNRGVDHDHDQNCDSFNPISHRKGNCHCRNQQSNHEAQKLRHKDGERRTLTHIEPAYSGYTERVFGWPRQKSDPTADRTLDDQMPDRWTRRAIRPRLPPGYAQHETQGSRTASCSQGHFAQSFLTSISLNITPDPWALVPTSLLPTRETERTSTRLPTDDGLRRTTTSSLNPNQDVVSVASIRNDVGSDATIFHTHVFGRSQRLGKCLAGGQFIEPDLRSGYASFCCLASSGPPNSAVVLRAGERQNGDEERRIFGVGRDVVDVRHARQVMFPLERQPKHASGNCQPDDRRSHPLRKHCCLPYRESREANDQRTSGKHHRRLTQTDPRLESPQS